jgi:hypothetical protein
MVSASLTLPPLTPLTGPPDALVFGFYGFLLVVLPGVGALVPVTLHELPRRMAAGVVFVSVVVSALVLWTGVYGVADVNVTFVLLGAVVLGTVVSEVATLVVTSQRGATPG